VTVILLNSNESDGLIATNVNYSYFIVCYIVKDNFITGIAKVAYDKMWAGVGAQRLESLGLL